MKKIELKGIERKLKKFLGAIGSSISSHTWYFTVLFFIIVLLVSVWVWWNCFQDPVPSSEVVLRVEQSKENYTEMKSRTEEVITTLQENRDRFENSPDFKDQRELFWEIDDEDPLSSVGGQVEIDGEDNAEQPTEDEDKEDSEKTIQ